MEERLYRSFFEVEESHWWFVARERIIAAVLVQLPLSPGRLSLLDVGCGTGGFLKSLPDRFETYGTDTSPLAVQFSRQRGLQNVFECRLEDFPRNDLRFDIITLLDVIEHVDDDGKLLQQALRLLNPGGFMLITVPAFPFLWSQHDVINHHKRRYTRKSLRNVIEGNGLIIEALTYFNFLLFPVAVIQRLLSSLLPGEGSPELSLPPQPINRLLTRIFASERHWLMRSGFPFGLSLLAVARSPAEHGVSEILH